MQNNNNRNLRAVYFTPVIAWGLVAGIITLIIGGIIGTGFLLAQFTPKY